MVAGEWRGRASLGPRGYKLALGKLLGANLECVGSGEFAVVEFGLSALRPHQLRGAPFTSFPFLPSR